MIPTISIKIKKFFSNFKGLFSKPQQENFILYVLGLMLPCNKTIQGITEELQLKKNQSSLNRFLTESKWKIEELYATLFEFIKPQLTGVVYLIVDDTLCEKAGKKIQGVARNFDHCEKRTVLSHSIVCAIIKCASILLPYEIKLYRKKEICRGITFKTKITLAEEIIQKFLSLDFKEKVILFDAFYGAADIIKAIGNKAMWVACCKSNRIVNHGKFNYSLKELAAYIKSEQYTEVNVNGKTYFVFEYEADMKGIGIIKIVFSKKKRYSKYISYFFTNMREANGREVLVHYSERWDIEVFFRDAKQNLGLGRYQMRSMKGILKHWYLVAVTYSLLSQLLSSLKKPYETIGQMCKFIRRNLSEIRLRLSVS